MPAYFFEYKVGLNSSMKTMKELQTTLLLLNNRGRWEKNLREIGIWDDIVYYTSWMPQNIPEYKRVKQRISYLINGFPDVPNCKGCGKPCAWQWDHFSEWCGIACRNKDQYFVDNLSVKQRENAPRRMKKREQTTLEKYGVKHIMQVNEIAEAAGARHKRTMIQRYGENWGKDFYNKQKEANGGIHPRDLAINKHSKGEYEVRQTLIDFGVSENDIEIGNRKVLNGKELDIYIPSKKFAIEYCGEFWHSEKGRPDKLHLFEKWKECKEKDIQLVCIFESEWINRKYQIMNLLRSKLVPALKIPARKCKFVKLASVDAKNFINRHHIQPITIMGDYTYGLVYNSEVVAVMTFRLHHRNSKDIVLNRFCCVDGISVIGGASKLLHNAMKLNGWSKVISWSDNRWSNGNLYKQLGFQLKAELKPDYMYWDGQKILSKQSCTKKALKARSDQTESQRAEELGLFKIWDCGKQSWTFEQTTSPLLMPYKGKIIVEKAVIKAPYIPLF